MKLININGKILSEDDAKISVFDRGFLFGDSVYEVTDSIEDKPLFIEEHLQRLFRSASKIDMPIGLSSKDIEQEVLKVLKALNAKRAYIRIIVTRGISEVTLDPTSATSNNLIIITKTIKENPSWWYDKGVDVIVAKTKRTASNSVDPAIKSGNYLNNIMAYNEAVKLGAFDAIMLNHADLVTEGTTSNLWIVRDKVIITPPLKAGLLEGITRAKVLEIAAKNKLSFKEENITKEELEGADEVFLTSSTKRIIPVVKVNTKKISNSLPGPITTNLISLYTQLINK